MRRGAVNVLFVIGLLMFLFGSGIAYWQYNAMTGAKAYYRKMDDEVPTREEVDNNLRSTEKELNEYMVKLNHLEKSVPERAYVPTMLSEIEALGKLNKIQVTGVRPVKDNSANVKKGPVDPNAPTKKKAYTEIDIDITGIGTYGDIQNFVQQLITFPKIVAVRTVALTPKKDEVGKANHWLETTIRLKAYVFALPEEKKEDEKDESKPGMSAMAGTPGGQG